MKIQGIGVVSKELAELTEAFYKCYGDGKNTK